MEPKISVIICTHNPRQDYISQVLEALKSQTLPLDVWELLLIDNASEKILASEIDISWHPQSRHIREEKLGLTPARLRGIKEASAEVLVFVDDDNVLEINYLETVLQISQKYTLIGAWGGQIIPKFDVPPQESIKPYLPLLALKQFDKDRWSNVPHTGTDPYGAGLCIRKVVADKYADLVYNDPRRMELGRKGASLACGEDSDMSLTACDMGLGMGLFTSLKLIHLIPAKRLQEDYLVKLLEQGVHSTTILNVLRGDPLPPAKTWRGKLREVYRLIWMNRLERRFFLATRKGESLAREQMSKFN